MPVPVTMEEYLSLEAPWLGRCRLSGLRIGEGEVLGAVVAGVHGNEITGIHAANLLIQRLTDPAAPLNLHGAVRVIPVANLAGAEEGSRRWPVEDANLQDLFPGDPEGWAGERLACAILRASTAKIGIELQTGSELITEWPHLRSHAPLPGQRSSPLMRWPPLQGGDPGSLADCWHASGMQSAVLRGGRAGTLDTAFAAALADAALALLAGAGVLDAPPALPAPPAAPIQTIVEIRSSRGGCFVPAVHCGDAVTAGQPLGTCHDLVGGGLQQQILAPADGTVMAIRAWPLVHGSELLARLALPA